MSEIIKLDEEEQVELENQEKGRLNAFYFGTMFLLLSFQAVLAFFKGREAGGILGYYLYQPTNIFLGEWGSLVLFILLFFVSIVILFNPSIKKILEYLKIFKVNTNKKDNLDEKKVEEDKQIIDQAELFTGEDNKDEEVEEEDLNEPEKKESFFSKFKKLFSLKKVEEGRVTEVSIGGSLPFDPEEDTIDNDTDIISNNENNIKEEENEKEEQKTLRSRKKRNKVWKLPPIKLLDDEKENSNAGNIKENALIIKQTFFDFGINVEMGDVAKGPTVSQFSFKPAKGTKLNKITSLHNDLALALAAHPIRIEAPIPGKSLVGVEVPNQKQAKVRLREIINHNIFKKNDSSLTIALGKDVSGSVAIASLDKMPHMLVAGTTGSGKSIFINDLLVSLLYQNKPEMLRLILVDPKRVELSRYNGIGHLLSPVIIDPKKTINALKWAVHEMEERLEFLSKEGKRDIISYNIYAMAKGKKKMPYIVIVIDELADLMMTAAKEVEGLIVRLAQMARAVGIHLVLATQRPSVNVITGLIKANITTRVAFKVASQVDSRTILDSSGAEKMIGRGDMLFQTSSLSSPKRIQSPFNTEEEVQKVINYIKEQGDYEETFFNTSEKENQEKKSLDIFKDSENNEEEKSDLDDPKFEEAKKIVIESKRASTTYLQRRLRIGYSRAASLIDMLEESGVVGPARGSKPREILIGQKEEENI